MAAGLTHRATREAAPLRLLSVVIPARDEEGCVASTVRRLHRELFGIRLNDTTNAFKAYRAAVVDGCRPLLAPHFNLTVELPLKAIVRGYSWTTVPITWRNRRAGQAELKLKEMGSRYLFICAYVWLEKYFSRGDYRKADHAAEAPGAGAAPG